MVLVGLCDLYGGDRVEAIVGSLPVVKGALLEVEIVGLGHRRRPRHPF
jgi:hypothetical protein